MHRTKLISGTLVLCPLLFFNAHATINGTAAAIQSGDQWAPGNLVLIDLPTKQTKVLHSGKAVGPGFSPDGKQVAFFVVSSTGMTLYRIPVTGSTADAVNTGIVLPYWPDNTWGVDKRNTCAYWLSLDNNMGNGEYFYWTSYCPIGSVPAGWQRAKVGGTTIESAFTVDTVVSGTRYGAFWGGVSRDGKHATCTSTGYQGWGIDIETQKWFRLYLSCSIPFGRFSACNTSISPDGMKGVSNNTNHNSFTISDMHTHQCLEVIDTETDPAWADCIRWSHHNDSLIMWRYYGAATGGAVINRFTKERLDIGAYVPYDIYPGRLLNANPQVAAPVFFPSATTQPAGQLSVRVTSATTDARIRYTTDGSDPTTTNGTAAPNGGTFAVEIDTGNTVIVKAVAYGVATMDPSVVQAIRYVGPAQTQPITLQSPVGGETFKVGDSLTVKYTTEATISSVQISLSVNNGMRWEEISPGAIITGSGAHAFKWKIPAAIGVGTSTVTTAALIKVEPYNGSGGPIYAQSPEAFTVAGAATASTKPTRSRASRNLRIAAGTTTITVRGHGKSVQSVSLISLDGKRVASLREAVRQTWRTNPAPAAGGYFAAVRYADGTTTSRRLVVR